MGKSAHKESSQSDTKVHKHRATKVDVKPDLTEEPKIKVMDLMPGMTMEAPQAQCQHIGSYNASDKAWELMLPQDTKLTVKNVRQTHPRMDINIFQ